MILLHIIYRFYRYDTRQRSVTWEGDFGPAFLKGECGDAPRENS